MENLIPQKPEVNINVSVETIYMILADYIDKNCYKNLLYKLYEKATQLETKRNELEGKVMKKDKKIDDLNQELTEWEDREINSLLDQFTEEERDDILDTFFIMINEYNKPVDHIKKARDRLKTKLFIHENASAALASLMSDLLSVVDEKLVPDDNFVYLDTNRLSEEERKKIERLWSSGMDERIEIGDQAIAFNPSDLHLQGNQILIDPKKLDPRERTTLMKALDPERGADSSVALPVRAFVQAGERVDEENIKTVSSFPEENPDRDVEEADESQYSDIDETSGGDPNDGLPFD